MVNHKESETHVDYVLHSYGHNIHIWLPAQCQPTILHTVPISHGFGPDHCSSVFTIHTRVSHSIRSELL